MKLSHFYLSLKKKKEKKFEPLDHLATITKERNKPQIIVQPALHPNPRFHVYILSLSLSLGSQPIQKKERKEKKKRQTFTNY